MAKVEGIQGKYPYCPDMPAVGRAAMDSRGMSQIKIPTTIECPYCRGYLWLYPQTIGRVVYEIGREGDKLNVIIDPLPPTHQSVHCRSCKVTFYTLL